MKKVTSTSTKNMEKGLLERMGLDDKESAIYLVLLEFGPLAISEIARKTGLHRPTIYQYLPSLENRGLVSEFPKGKRKEYIAESPEKLKVMFGELWQEFDQLLPHLKFIFKNKGKRPLVKFLEGKNGIKSVYEDLLRSTKRGDVFYRYSSRKDTTRGEAYLLKNYRELRDKKQLERFVITNRMVSKQKKPRMERAIKTVPAEYGLFDYNVTQLIYADRIAFLDYNTETALIIENPIIAEFQKKIFKLLYDKL